MSRTLRIRFKTFLPGTGFNAAGNPKQGKQRVVGKVHVTNYQRDGENLSPADVGLRTIDYISLTVDEAMTGSGGEARTAHYSSSAQQFYILEGAGKLAATADPVVSFVAEGDSAEDVEIL
jgi:hypothetical protein